MSTVKLNQPITWVELKELTPTLQVLYLDNLIHHYHGRLCDIADMLGVEPTTLGGHIKRLPGKLDFTGVRGKRKVQPPEWLEFVEGRAKEIAPEDIRATPDPDPIVEVQPVEIEQPVLPDRIDLSITGTPAQLIDLLSMLTEADRTYSFRLSFNK